MVLTAGLCGANNECVTRMSNMDKSLCDNEDVQAVIEVLAGRE